MPSADEELLKIYKGEFAPPAGWNEAAAKSYRQQLNGVTSGKLARFAAIGQITMGSDIIPDSFPFFGYDKEPVNDQDVLSRSTLIRNAINKYDPYSTDAWEPIVLQDGRGDKVSYDTLKFAESIVGEGPRPKDPVVEYLKSLPPSPGPKMRIKSDAASFQASNYSPDKLFTWIDGEITGNPLMLNIHNALKRAAGDFMLTLYEEQRDRKLEIMRLIDYEIRQNVRLGTEGRYVNRYSMDNALSNLSKPNRSRLLYQIDLDEATYEFFNPVIDVDNKGFKKWRKYADIKRKKYNHFMNVLTKQVVNTAGGGKKEMEKYAALNADAAKRRAAIAAIQRVKATRAAATAGATFAAGVANAAAIQAQNDDVDQFIKDVNAKTSLVDLNQYLSTIGKIDTSLLPNQSVRENQMGQAVRDKERMLKSSAVAQPFSVAIVMSNKGRADPACSVTGETGYIARMTGLGFPNDALLDATKLAALITQFTEDQLKELFSGANGGICSGDQEEILHIMSGKNNSTVKKYLKITYNSNSPVYRAITAKLWSTETDFKFVDRRIDIYKKWDGVGCAKTRAGRYVEVSNLNIVLGTVDTKVIPQTLAEKDGPPITGDGVLVEDLEPLTLKDCGAEQLRNNLAISAERDRLQKANVEFGVLKKEDALRFLKSNNPTLETTDINTSLEWFDDPSVKPDDQYNATLYHKTKNGKIVQLVIACLEGPPDVIGLVNSATTMELLEIHNYDKDSAGSIRPFVVKVLNEATYGGVNTVYLSPADEDLVKMYRDSWGMESLGIIDGNRWMKADKSTLINNLRKSASDFRAEQAAALVNKLPKLTSSVGVGSWRPLKDESGNILFYGASPTDNQNILDLLDKLPDHPNVIKYSLVTPELKSGVEVLKIGNIEYVMEPSDLNDVSSDITVLITPNMGVPLTSDDLINNLVSIKKQSLEALNALHTNNIVHQDIQLENMVWNGQTLTLIDLGNAKIVNNACEASFNGDMNLLPPVGLGDAKFGDTWSLVLALLNLESLGVTKLLFNAKQKTNKVGNCSVLVDSTQQNGLMFKSNKKSNVIHRKNEIKKAVEEKGEKLFHYLWMIWEKEEDITAKNMQHGLIPGYGDKSAAAMSGLSTNADNPKDDHDYISELVARMSGNNIEFAKAWVRGHLRLKQIETIISNKTVSLVTKAKLLEVDTSQKQYDDITLGDLGTYMYGIPTAQVVEIFELLKSQSITSVLGGSSSFKERNTFLDYDSFSDAELDEFEESLEPYDEEELDRMMEGAITGMAKDAYDSMSDSSFNTGAKSYDSSSDSSLSGAAVSYDSSSDGGFSGAAQSYNSESEQSYNNSEHGASYDSDSDEDR